MAESVKEAKSNRSAAKRLLVWLAVVLMLLAVYAAAGFALVPWLVKTRLPEYSASHFKHRITVGEVKFDPFKLIFEAGDVRLAEPDGTQMFGLGALTIDLEWSSLVERTWRFALVRLTTPAASLAIAADGRFNLAEFIAALNSEPAKEKQPLPRLAIDRFELGRGRIDFDDRRAGYRNSLSPIDFAIDHLSTLPDRNGPYTFSANTTRGGSIRWKGEASLNPIAGRGELLLDAISLPELAAYAKPFTEIAMTGGKLGAKLPYRFAYAEGKLAFDVNAARLDLAELALRIGGIQAPTLKLATMQIENVNASLDRGELSMSAIRLADGGLHIAAANGPTFMIPTMMVEGISANRDRGRLSITGLKVSDLGMRLHGVAAPAVLIPSLSIDGLDATLEPAELVLGSVKLAGGRIAVKRDSRGMIDLSGFQSPSSEAQAPSPAVATAPAPWKVLVRQVGLENFALAYSDLTSATPMQLAVGKAGLKLSLEASQSTGGMAIKVGDGGLAVSDVVIGGSGNPPVRVAELGVGGAAFDSAARSMIADRVWLKGAQLKIALDAAGKANLLDLIPRSAGAPSVSATRSGTSVPAAAPGKATAPFKAGVKLVDISAVSADFEDAGSGIKLRGIDAGARLTGVSSNLNDAIGFDAGIKLREGGDLRAKGRVVPAGAVVDAVIKVERLALAPLQSLLSKYVKLSLASGTANAEGKLAIGSRDAQVRYTGSFGLADLRFNEEGGKQFAALKNASADGIDLRLGPNALLVPELRLEALHGQLIIDADRSLNAQRLLVQSPPKDTAIPASASAGQSAGSQPATAVAPVNPAAAAAPASAAIPIGADADPFPVTVRRLRIDNAKLDFEDLSLRPQFGARIHELAGVITGLSTNPATRSKLELDGRVDEFGLARIRGELNPFAPRANTDVNLVFKNVDMVTATPYAMKFAGYKIAAGKISLDLNYKVRNSQLEGDNQVVIDQLTLGERVDSPDAIKLPLELALAILKDSDGRIDLGLPVTGSLDDPQFSYGAVIWKAIVNVLTRIVTAPFRALGALFGGDGAKLESIDFDPGSARLLPPEREKLRQVVQVLTKRAQLKLAVPGQYSESADAPVLRDRALRAEILRRAGLKIVADEEPGPLDLQDRAQRLALRETFSARQGAPALEQLRAESERAAATPAAAGSAPAKREQAPLWRRALNVAQGEPNLTDPAAFYRAIATRLAASQPIGADALVALATERSNTIASALKEAGIDSARIAQPPVEKTEATGKVVPLKLGLASR